MKQAKTLNERELKVVLAHCATRRHGARDRAIVLVSFYAGLRAKEIAALSIGNVLSDSGEIREECVLTPSQTKGRKARRIFFSTKLRKELAGYLSKIDTENAINPLFETQKGTRFSANTMCQLFLDIYCQCGIDGASSHSGRRSFITNLASKGVSVRVLAELASHANLATTQRYIDVNDRQLKAAIELF